ncbi:cyclin [Penicillium angulare]|uniref:Cyclin n=1 Tax=Penicillium angulare TaxID=116970 RepID=A0A9W9JVX3_9EURO|nr:cyclin [Penicillium angulare]
MDFYLRCNSLTCRAYLKERAVVTTCSHIFCPGCADGLGLSHPTSDNRHCPACQTILFNPDDAVSTILNPTEDYKTSVLSGLDPSTIMECAGRALGFWAYQSTQEILYQEFLGKSLTEKYTGLNTQMDKLILNANSEISNLHSKLTDLQGSQEQLQKKNEELVDMYREKSKKLSQMTNLYNLLKTRAMRSRMETAAFESVSNTLNTAPRIAPAASTTIPQPPRIPTLPLPRPPKTPSYPKSPDGIEQLHRHHRSGTVSSRRAGKNSSKVKMMQAPYPTLNRPKAQIANTMPQHRTRLPRSTRLPTNLSQLPPEDVIMARFGN